MAVYNTAYKSGTISSFSGTTVTVSGFTPAAGDVGRILIINSGSAKLQHREITAVSGQDITIAHAWNTNPFIDPSSDSRATDVNPSNGDTIVISYDLSDLIATDSDLTLTDENHVLVSGTLEASNGAYIHAKNLHIEWNSNQIDIGLGGGMIFGYYGYVSGEDSYTKDSCNIADNLNSFAGDSIRKGSSDYGLFDIYGGSYYSGQTTGVFLRCYANAPSDTQVRMIGVKQKGNVGGRYDGNRSMLVIDAVAASTTVGVANPLTPVARVELSATGCDQAGYAHLGIAPNGNLVFPRLRDIALKVIRTTSAGTGVYTVRAKKAEIDLIDPFLQVGNTSPNTTFRYGNLVKPSFVDSSGVSLSGTLVTRLYDSTGASVNNENVTSGSYTEFFARHTDISLATAGHKNLSDGTQYAPYTLRGIQYGKQFGLTNISVEDTFEPAIVYLDDANITELNQATVGAYTELETPQKLYDRAVYWLESNITNEQSFLVSRSGNSIDAGSYNVVIDANATPAFSLSGNTMTIHADEFIGNITTTGTITLLNGSKIIGNATDSSGTTITLPYSITGLVAGSNVRIFNVTNNSEFSVGIVAGTSESGTYTEGVEISAGDTIEIQTVNTIGTTAYYEKTVTVVASASGLNALVNQELNTIYNDNGIDGSTVTGITLDVPNVEFDLDESDDTISSQEIYAWYMNELMTTDGIRTIYKAIQPKSQYRYCIDPNVVDLKFDNKDLVNSLAITNGYFYSLDNTSVIASGSGNIEMIPNESYVANSTEIVNGISSIESKVDIVDNNVDQILFDTDELQQNQGNWLTATGFSTFNPATDQVTVSTNNDKAGYSISGTKNTLDALNDISSTDVKAQADQALNEYDAATKSELDSAESSIISSIPSVANIADGVWDEPYNQHTTASTFGKLMDILRKSNRAIEGEVTGTPTITSFTSNITGYVTGAFDSEVLVFVSGTINGEARPILSYNETNGTFNFEEAWTQAPSANDEFVILPYHVHAISEIHEGLATKANQEAINNNVKDASLIIPAIEDLPD